MKPWVGRLEVARLQPLLIMMMMVMMTMMNATMMMVMITMMPLVGQLGVAPLRLLLG